MTGQELIYFIEQNHLEDYDIGVYREGYDVDFFYGGLDAEINHEKKEVRI